MLFLPAKSLGSQPLLSGRPLAHSHLFGGRPAPAGRHLRARKQLRVSAQQLLWPDKELINQALEEFPDKGVASVEEARALVSNGGYTYLDVRPEIEYDEVGKTAGSVNVPFKNGQKKWSSEKKKKVFTRKDNPDFVQQVEKRFPDKEKVKLLVSCSDGREYSMDALMALDEAGYTNIVGLKGGFYKYSRTFDNKGNRRKFGEYEEDLFKDGDSTAIHASGAGFSRVDAIEPVMPIEYEDDEE